MHRVQKKRKERGTRKGTREQALAPKELSAVVIFLFASEIPNRILACRGRYSTSLCSVGWRSQIRKLATHLNPPKPVTQSLLPSVVVLGCGFSLPVCGFVRTFD